CEPVDEQAGEQETKTQNRMPSNSGNAVADCDPISDQFLNSLDVSSPPDDGSDRDHHSRHLFCCVHHGRSPSLLEAGTGSENWHRRVSSEKICPDRARNPAVRLTMPA